MPKYQTNDIVLIKTSDAFTGEIETVGIVRYYMEDCDAYEVNVIKPSGEAPMDMDHIAWWGLSEREIVAKIGEAKIERPVKRELGAKIFNVVRF